MWAHSKIVGFFKFGLTVKKLLIVEICHPRHCRHKNNVKNGAYAIFQQRITFEPLIPFSKTEVF